MRANQEMRHPALVLSAHLVQAVDAAHAEHHRGQAEGARVIEHILIGGALRAAVGAVKIERPLLADAGAQRGIERLIARAVLLQRQIGKPAVDLVGGSEEQRRRIVQRADLLQQIQRAADVHFEIVERIGQAGGHRHLRREMKHLLGGAHRGAQRLRGCARRRSRRAARRRASRAATRDSAPRRAATDRRRSAPDWPADSRRSARLVPMKPAPPVISTCRCRRPSLRGARRREPTSRTASRPPSDQKPKQQLRAAVGALQSVVIFALVGVEGIVAAGAGSRSCADCQ